MASYSAAPSASIVPLDLAPLDDTFTKNREAVAAGQSASSKAKNCAECRRLKVKCDRKVPCQNCVRRGCASLCPDGQLVSKGNRLVLSNTEDLHSRIEVLSSRIRELETALASSHSKHSDESHPLLTPDQLLTGTIRKEEEDPNDAPVASFGSLMIGGDGTAKFFGATSGAEWVIPLEDDSPQKGYHCMPVSVANSKSSEVFKGMSDFDIINAQFPGPIDREPLNIDRLRQLTLSELPPRDKAISLINIYYARVAWEFDPVPRSRLIKEYFGPCYDHLPNPRVSGHGLALLYAVFGMGMFHNPEQSNYGALAYHYITLSRAALAVDCVFVNTSITAIDTLLLHIGYLERSDDPGGEAKSWVALGTTIKLAQAVKPSLWNLPEEEVNRRRRTMWELVSRDLWSSLHLGRPPMVSRQHFDVQIPLDQPDPNVAEANFHRGKHFFSEKCLWPVLDLALASSNKGSYSAVLKLDKKIRDWVLPANMQAPKHEPAEDQQTAFYIQKTIIFTVREVTLMCLHRSYFACALTEPPFEPLRHRFSRSVLAAYASACAVLGRIRSLYARESIIMARFNFFWTHSFSAAVILGVIVTRAPDCPLAATALVEFDFACEMFNRAQMGYRPGRLLPVLMNLKAKAHAAMDAYRSGTWKKPTVDDQLLFPGLGGYRAVLQHTRQSPGPQAHSPSGSSSSEGENIMTSLESVQPTLDEYLRSFQSLGPSDSASGGGVDAFLQSALTGNWGNMNVNETDWTSVWDPPSSGNVKQQQQQQQPPPQQNQQPSLYQPNPAVNYGQSIAPPTFNLSSHSPFSDGGVSSASGNSTNPPGHAMHFSDGASSISPTFQPVPVPPPVVSGPNLNLTTPTNIKNGNNAQLGAVDERDKFSWDDFLMQLGMQN
ncbi:hypothetical protein CPB86DRAFT_771214 [Serendipita vermifera]|nr:hypothetical protein CPB86DRAFT_771214 [Serendipita vermifera]